MFQHPNLYAAGVASARIDRASHHRKDPAWIAARLADPATRLLPFWRSKHLVGADAAPRARFLAAPEAADLIGELADTPSGGPIFIALFGDTACFAVDLSHLDAPERIGAVARHLGNGAVFSDLRSVGPVLPREESALLAHVRGMAIWHGRHRFCGVCGGRTKPVEAGNVRRCVEPDCGAQHFPRSDPAVIVLVSRPAPSGARDEDLCLLGRAPRLPPGIYSTLAGFVEPGESLEDTVYREVLEESGIRTVNHRYHSSQPWPFPSSLMLGFHAEAIDSEIRPDQEELEDCRWVSRGDLLTRPETEDFRLPRRDSIAYRLILDWLKA